MAESTGVLVGERVRLRPADLTDVPRLADIRSTPSVRKWWRGPADLTAEVIRDLTDDEVPVYVIEHGGQVIGAIQWGAETEPDYRHASIDIFVDPDAHGQGLGTDAIRTLVRHLIVDQGFHRIVIDPAADNTAAIRCYTKVGFRPVGVMRQYERGEDGTWHDGLLLDLLSEEFEAGNSNEVPGRS